MKKWHMFLVQDGKPVNITVKAHTYEQAVELAQQLHPAARVIGGMSIQLVTSYVSFDDSLPTSDPNFQQGVTDWQRLKKDN